MECDFCQIRSAVGRCEETNKLVCEECSIGCYKCGKRIAVTAGHETKSGHVYCTTCFKERAARKSGRDPNAMAAGGGLIQDDVVRRPKGGEEAPPEEVFDEEMVLAKWKPPAPWKMSLYLALVALAMCVFFVVFPSFSVIPLGSRNIPLGLVAIFLAVVGALWAVVGVVAEQFAEDKSRSFIGLGLAVLAAVAGIVVAMRPIPLSDAEAELRGGDRPPQFNSEAEREAWRQQFLQGGRE